MKTNDLLRSSLCPLAVIALAASPQATQAPQGEGASRPSPLDRPTEVSVEIFLVDVFDIDDVSETFTADLAYLASWHDPRLADPGNDSKRVFSLEKIWDPGITILNGKSIEFSLPEVAEVDRDGVVSIRQRAIGEFSCELDLRSYPADTQGLIASFLTVGYDPSEVRLTTDESKMGSRPDISPAGWSVQLGRFEVTTERITGRDRELSRVDFHLTARRLVSHFRYKVFFPLCLIMFMAWAAFWISPKEFGTRVRFATASVFTLIAFEIGLSNNLPKISYLTQADQFVLGCTILVFLALGEAVFTAQLASGGRIQSAIRIDRYARVIYPLAFAGVVLGALRDVL